MLVIELYDSSLKKAINSIPRCKKPESGDKIEKIPHNSENVSTVQVMVPQLFSSKYFSIPKFLCGSIVVLRNVQPFTSRGKLSFPVLTPSDNFALSGLQGANQIPNTHYLAHLLIRSYYLEVQE